MKLNVTTWQRTALVEAVGSIRGNMVTIHEAMAALDVLRMSDKDKQLVGFRALPNGTTTWENAEHKFELEIEDQAAADLVRRAAREFEGWPAGMAAQVIELSEQLEGERNDE